ncbi:MAG: cob(I)yrinic acid a,c-diamide adenosyltransferase, partial [candidate division Zixibacteria bacterium]|nr:cob(I)yrinic acid a,c-diamide adenosyltransferase [candidate division Zixibacteria bacterium]
MHGYQMDTKRKGLIIVFTGYGKGKTTAALGMALRAAGHGMRVLVIQFIKNFKNYGELKFVKKHISGIEIKTFGKGYVGIRGDKLPIAEHRKMAEEALKLYQKKAKSGKYDIIILDEINIALKLKLLDLKKVVRILKRKPKNLHLVLTGRDTPAAVVKMADLVTEMKEIKHPFR